jgi:hypothetical protein
MPNLQKNILVKKVIFFPTPKSNYIKGNIPDSKKRNNSNSLMRAIFWQGIF